MASFKDHRVRVNDLLGFIPESLLSHLSATTTVDYYTKSSSRQKDVLPTAVRYSGERPFKSTHTRRHF